MGRSLLIAACGVLCALGCGSKSAYVCSSTTECIDHGTQGVCEPEGYCSFPDPSCPGGRKFEPNAGGGLGGTCVMVDAGVGNCGAVGQACCSTGPACGGNGFCASGTCQECVTAVAPGRHASCLLKYDHTVWCAGDNQYGELGTGQIGTPVSEWMQVRDTNGSPLTDATAIASGWEFTCAIRTGGEVWCWGLNNDGNLGNNTTTLSAAAVRVQNTNGQPLTGIAEIGAGYSHVCGRDMASAVWCWGDNGDGDLGDGTIVDKHQAVPVTGAATSGVLALSVGGDHACIRKANDAIWCWGRNNRGQVADGTTMNRTSPVSVGTATSVAAGQHHTCFGHSDGTVWCAGDHWRNRLGNGIVNYDGSPQNNPTPLQVVASPGGPPFTGAASVTAGGESCALMQDKTVMCWGDDPYGETGTGAGGNVPAAVLNTDRTPLTDVNWIVADGPHVCAHRTDGQLLCWGRNLEGELGDGTFENRGLATPLRFSCP